MLRPSNVTLKEYQHADTEENNERWPSDLVTPFWLVETSGRFYEQAVVIRRELLARRRTSEILGDLHIGIMISSGSAREHSWSRRSSDNSIIIYEQ